MCLVAFPLDILISHLNPRVLPWNLIISEIKGLKDYLNSKSTPSFQDGKTEAQKGETSCRADKRESSIGSNPVLSS